MRVIRSPVVLINPEPLSFPGNSKSISSFGVFTKIVVSFSGNSQFDCTMITSRDVHEVVWKLSSDKAKTREVNSSLYHLLIAWVSGRKRHRRLVFLFGISVCVVFSLCLISIRLGLNEMQWRLWNNSTLNLQYISVSIIVSSRVVLSSPVASVKRQFILQLKLGFVSYWLLI